MWIVFAISHLEDESIFFSFRYINGNQDIFSLFSEKNPIYLLTYLYELFSRSALMMHLEVVEISKKFKSYFKNGEFGVSHFKLF